jgi:hypothetical protein
MWNNVNTSGEYIGTNSDLVGKGGGMFESLAPSDEAITNAWLVSQASGGDKKQQRPPPGISAPGRAGNPSAMMMRQPVGLLGGGRPQRRSFRR